MKDGRRYCSQGTIVTDRSDPEVAAAICKSTRIAKLIANCLNLYQRSRKFSAQVLAAMAAEKGETHHGNRSDERTKGSSTHAS